MDSPRRPERALRPGHRLLEHYTPDGWLGRLLLAVIAGSVGGTALLGTVWFVAVALPFWPVLALVASGAGLAGVGLALVVLWPVYLSLIGNVESAAAYPGGEATPSAEPTLDLDAADSGDTATDPDDAVAVLKRRYAAGDITEEEFERRIDDLLGVEAALGSDDRPAEAGTRSHESERN